MMLNNTQVTDKARGFFVSIKIKLLEFWNYIIYIHLICNSGKGVFALRNFAEGEFLLEYQGELISYKEGSRRMAEYPQHLGSFIYLFNYKNKKFW